MSRLPDETERARTLLAQRLAPLWEGEENARGARTRVVRFVAACLGLDRDKADLSALSIDQCRAAYRVTVGLTYAEVLVWSRTGTKPPARAELAYPEEMPL